LRESHRPRRGRGDMSARRVSSSELEFCLNQAFHQARSAHHEFLTVERLLLAILDTPTVREVLDLDQLGADLSKLRIQKTIRSPKIPRRPHSCHWSCRWKSLSRTASVKGCPTSALISHRVWHPQRRRADIGHPLTQGDIRLFSRTFSEPAIRSLVQKTEYGGGSRTGIRGTFV